MKISMQMIVMIIVSILIICLVFANNKNTNIYSFTNSEQKYFDSLNNLNVKEKMTIIPKDFKLGFSSAAYQIEGASTVGGRGLSQWDEYLMGGNSRLTNTGQFAANFYYAYKDDFKRLKAMGVNTFRFSIAWTRIYPNGESSRLMVNPNGINYYKSMISELIKVGIEPVICLCHWDMPAQLINSLATKTKFKGLSYNTSKDKNKNGILLDKILMDSWSNYCNTVYDLIIKPYRKSIYYVSSINELCTIANNAYSAGYMAPGISMNRKTNNYGDWNSTYWALYNLIRMHRRAYKLYKNIFKGKSGPGTGNPWFTADTSFIQNVVPDAPDAYRKGEETKKIKPLSVKDPYWIKCREWGIQMVWDPLIKGKWSTAVSDFFKTARSKQKWRGEFPPSNESNPFEDYTSTVDIIAFHYYNNSVPIKDNRDDLGQLMEKGLNDNSDSNCDINCRLQKIIDSNVWGMWDVDAGMNRGNVLMSNTLVPFGSIKGKDPSGVGWIGYYPEGMGKTADILHELYPDYYLMQTESGMCEAVDQRVTVRGSVNDIVRVDYYSRSLDSLLKSQAHKDGKVLGCLYWAHIDNLEWMSGFVDTFGCYYCNYWGPGDYGIRNPKMSSGWLAATSKLRRILTTQQVWNNHKLFSPPIHKDLIPKLCDKKNRDGTLVKECNGINKPLNSIILTNALKTKDNNGNDIPVDKVGSFDLKQSCQGTGIIRQQWRACGSTQNTPDYSKESFIYPKK